MGILFVGYFLFNDIIGPRAEEPRRAVVGMEALLGDNILVPTIHGEAYYNKPPVFNWILGASFWLFDSFGTEALRFPGALSLWLIAGFVVYMVRKFHNTETGIVAGLIFLTFGDLLFYGAINSGEIDLFYSLVTFAQALAIFWFGEKKKWLSLFVVSYCITALGLLTKGLPSIAFQGLTLLGFFTANRSFSRLFSWQHVLGASLMVGIISGYFMAYSNYNDASAFMVNLWSESSSKSVNEATGNQLFKALYSFPIQLIQITLPWSFFIIWYKELFANRSKLVHFCTIFLIANLWLYWISPELRNRYLYTFFPFIAILLGIIVSNLRKRKRFELLTSKIVGILGSIVGIAFIIIPYTPLLPTEFISISAFMVFGLVLFGMGIYGFVAKNQGILSLFMVLGVLRLAYNVCLLPVQAAESKANYYAEHVEEMLEISKGEELFWTGNVYNFHPEIALAGVTFLRDSIQTPPLLAYQIPYYYTLQTGDRFLYTSQPQPRKWLVASEDYARQYETKIHYTFLDKWTQKNLVLYTIDESL